MYVGIPEEKTLVKVIPTSPEILYFRSGFDQNQSILKQCIGDNKEIKERQEKLNSREEIDTIFKKMNLVISGEKKIDKFNRQQEGMAKFYKLRADKEEERKSLLRKKEKLVKEKGKWNEYEKARIIEHEISLTLFHDLSPGMKEALEKGLKGLETQLADQKRKRRNDDDNLPNKRFRTDEEEDEEIKKILGDDESKEGGFIKKRRKRHKRKTKRRKRKTKRRKRRK